MHHQKSVLCKDGLPKLKDLPKELGGSGARDSRMILTRRSVVMAGGILGASLMVGPWEALAASLHCGPSDAPAIGPSVLDPSEIADLDAMTAQIIPTDATPGAREAGVVHFIDRALRSFCAPIATEFRAGLAEFRRGVRARYPESPSFAALPHTQQLEWLQSIEHSPFFASVRQLTVLGMFSNPTYAGNRDGIGWRLLGFVDEHVFAPPFGHYDRDYPGFPSFNMSTS